MAPNKGEPTSTISASQEEGQRDTFISPKFQLLLSTCSLGSLTLEVLSYLICSYSQILTTTHQLPGTHFQPPRWPQFLLHRCPLHSFLHAAIHRNFIYPWGFQLGSPLLPAQLLSLSTSTPLHMKSFLSLLTSLSHFFLVSIISNHSSPLSHFFQFNLHAMVQGFSGEQEVIVREGNLS